MNRKTEHQAYRRTASFRALNPATGRASGVTRNMAAPGVDLDALDRKLRETDKGFLSYDSVSAWGRDADAKPR